MERPTSATDHTVFEIVLTVTNDGNGSQCGFSYQQRLEAARQGEPGRLTFRYMARNYGRYAHRQFGAAHPTLQQTSAAGDELYAYYRELLAEIDSPEPEAAP